MDAERQHEALSSPAVERELHALLAVEPSPQFLARVRTRIAATPAPAAWWLSWRLALSVAAAAFVVAVAARGRWGATDHVPGRTTPVLASTALPATSTTVIALGGHVVERQRAVPGRGLGERLVVSRGAIAVAAGGVEPQVLVDEREAAALRALIAGVRAGRVDLTPMRNASTPAAMELPPVAEITIQPIAIDPLEQGVRQ